MRHPRTTAPKAFTFIEVLVALAIVAIALLGLLRLHLASLVTARTAEMMTQAVFIAQEQAAQTCAAGFPRIGTGSGVTDRNGTRFEWTTNVTDARLKGTSGPTVKGLREIHTIVSWEEGKNVRSVQTTMYTAESHFHE